MAKELYTYVDANGKPIKAGTRIKLWSPPYAEPPSYAETGVIEYISDPDGDVDDEGRSIGIAPEVHVLFDDGEKEFYLCHSTAQWYTDEDLPFKCEDIEVIDE